MTRIKIVKTPKGRETEITRVSTYDDWYGIRVRDLNTGYKARASMQISGDLSLISLVEQAALIKLDKIIDREELNLRRKNEACR